MKIWWQDEDSDIGWYSLMLDESELAYMCYIPIKYRNCTERERKIFKGGLYEVGYCLDGCSSNWVLNAKTLEEAKKEVQDYFVEYYKNRIKAAKNRIKHCENVLNALIGEMK